VNTHQVIEEIRTLLSKHKGDERELYEELVNEASGWEMRLEELEEEAEGEDAIEEDDFEDEEDEEDEDDE
jgi:hypothetical protein